MAKKDAKPPAPAAAPAEGEEGAPVKKKLPMKLVLMGAAAAVVVLGGGGTAAFMLLGGGGEAEAEEGGGHGAAPKAGGGGGHGAAGEEGEAVAYGTVREGPEGVVFYTLPDMVANISTNGGRPAFLKLKLTLELPDHATAEAFAPNAPRLADMFTTFLRELRQEDLAGAEGSYQLRMELQRRVNLVIAPAHVNAVLIEEMLIQ